VRGRSARAPQKASMRPENSLYGCYSLSNSELQKPRKLLSLNPLAREVAFETDKKHDFVVLETLNLLIRIIF
jgi:hypothetical protein